LLEQGHFVGGRRVIDLDLEEKAVGLRLGQGKGALVFDRVLRGDDEEMFRQRARTPSTVAWCSSIASSSADWVLGGVRLISSASRMSVKIGPGKNLKVWSRAGKDVGADQVRGHQIGRELDALEADFQARGQRAGEERFGQAGHAFEDDMAAGEQRDERFSTSVSWPTMIFLISCRISAARVARVGVHAMADLISIRSRATRSQPEGGRPPT
jgi:hypothetical protein